MQYERLKAGSRTPWDAVVVTVRQIYGRAVADVAAVEQVAGHPVPVRQALSEAEALRTSLDLKRIVVVLEDETPWQDNWGELKDDVAA